MEIKFLELRDYATCIPAIAIKMEPKSMVMANFLIRCGYPPSGDVIVLMKLMDQRATSDPYEWGDRTMTSCHIYINENYNKLEDGDVVDARVFLGEEENPVEPEITGG